MGKKVFVCGGVSFNSVITLPKFFEPSPQTIHNCDFNETIGNTGAGKALALSKLGFSTFLHSLIGKDDFGYKVIEKLNQSNLKFGFEIDPNGTERHLNILNQKGERISIFLNPSSAEIDVDYNYYKTIIKNSDFVVINISNYCRGFISIAKQLNKSIWTDLHDYDGRNKYHQEFIDASDYIFFSSVNFKEYKEFMKQMINKGKKLVICTHGDKGSTAYTRSRKWIYMPAINDFKLINSNGAGDSYFAGFLYSFEKGNSTEISMRYASICGGISVTSKKIVSENLNATYLEKIYDDYF